MNDVVTLQLPRDRDFFGVAHLVLGGLGARFDLTYDVLEDMNDGARRAARASRGDRRRHARGSRSATARSRRRSARSSGRVVDELHASDAGLGLRRVLETVVDSVSISERDGGHWVELRKHVEAVPHVRVTTASSSGATTSRATSPRASS